MLEIPFSNKLYFQPEILYSSKGFKFDDEYQESNNRLNYIDLPLLLKFYITKNFNVVLGPQASFLLTAVSSSDSSYDADITGLNNLDFGLNLGLGIKFNTNMTLDLRYAPGLSNINKESDLNNKNSLFLVSLGYFF
jgi:cellobiose-specific phosphotransferase system component IIB|tara:strand:- start:1096 stop:1503 length:408 start_codon:yes stop_codon:yes gene_type:complete